LPVGGPQTTFEQLGTFPSAGQQVERLSDLPDNSQVRFVMVVSYRVGL